MGFLEACREGDYRRASSFLNLRRGQDGPELAQQLQDVLDSYWRSDPATVSNAPDGDLTDGLDPQRELLGLAPLKDREAELMLERVTRGDQRLWLFSSTTVTLVPLIDGDKRRILGIEEHLPKWMLREGPLQTALWVWFALLLLIAAAFTASSIVVKLFSRAVRPLIRHTSSDLDDNLIESTINPIRLLLAVIAFQAGLVALPTSVLFRTVFGRVATALMWLGFAWLVLRTIDVIAQKAVARMGTRHRLSAASTVPLARRTAKALVVAIAVLAILNSWGYNTTTLLAGLGVGGLAVALAAQKTLENFLGGVSVATDRPVLIGDFCRYGDRVGTIEDIGLRSTRIRTLDRTLITIPNGQFSSLEIENFGRRDKIFFHPMLNLRRDTTPDQVRALIPSLRQILLDHPKVDPNPARVRFIGIGQYSLDLEVFAYVQTTDFDEFLVIQEELLLAFLDRIAQAGTALAVPAQMSIFTRDPLRHSNRPPLLE